MCDTIVSDNWVQLLKEYQKDFGKWFRAEDSGKKLYFLGLLHSDDDYYYALSYYGEVVLYSCVCSMEENGLRMEG